MKSAKERSLWLCCPLSGDCSRTRRVGTTVVNGINDAGVLVGFYGTVPINTVS